MIWISVSTGIPITIISYHDDTAFCTLSMSDTCTCVCVCVCVMPTICNTNMFTINNNSSVFVLFFNLSFNMTSWQKTNSQVYWLPWTFSILYRQDIKQTKNKTKKTKKQWPPACCTKKATRNWYMCRNLRRNLRFL